MPKVDAKGRVTLPKEIRDRLGIDPGSTVEVREQEGRVVVEPERDPADIISELEAAVADLDRSESAEDETRPDPIAEHHRERIRRGADRDE